MKQTPAFILIGALYVDDMLIIGNDIEKLENMKIELCKKFEMKELGESRMVLCAQRSCNQEMGMLTI